MRNKKNSEPRPCAECAMFKNGTCDIGYAFSIHVACSGFSEKPTKRVRKNGNRDLRIKKKI